MHPGILGNISDSNYTPLHTGYSRKDSDVVNQLINAKLDFSKSTQINI